MKPRAPRRPAFTLVELLVVISIIVILVALTATAVVGVRRNMQKTNAEATLEAIDTKILKKIKETEDRINNELRDRSGSDNPEVYTILNDCSGNKDMAKAILLYARLRRDLPMTFQEANPILTNRFSVCGYTYAPSPAFAGLPNSGAADIPESAVCLYAAIAPMGLEGLEQRVATDAVGRKYFTDGMGQPIGFVRLGYGGNNGELNKGAFDPFYPNKNAQTGLYRNLSSEYDAILPAHAAPNNFQNRVWNGVRPNVTWASMPAYPGTQYHTAFCFAAGLNEDFDDTTVGLFNGDNLFSYRTRKEGAKGD